MVAEVLLRLRFPHYQPMLEVLTERQLQTLLDQADIHLQSHFTQLYHCSVKMDPALLLPAVRQRVSVSAVTPMSFYFMDKNLCASIHMLEEGWTNLLLIKVTGYMLIWNSRIAEGGYGLIHLQTRHKAMYLGHVYDHQQLHHYDVNLSAGNLKEGFTKRDC